MAKKMPNQLGVHEVDNIAGIAATEDDASESTIKAARVFPEMKDGAPA
jgi:hypothetical protein